VPTNPYDIYAGVGDEYSPTDYANMRRDAEREGLPMTTVRAGNHGERSVPFLAPPGSRIDPNTGTIYGPYGAAGAYDVRKPGGVPADPNLAGRLQTVPGLTYQEWLAMNQPNLAAGLSGQEMDAPRARLASMGLTPPPLPGAARLPATGGANAPGIPGPPLSAPPRSTPGVLPALPPRSRAPTRLYDPKLMEDVGGGILPPWGSISASDGGPGAKPRLSQYISQLTSSQGYPGSQSGGTNFGLLPEVDVGTFAPRLAPADYPTDGGGGGGGGGGGAAGGVGGGGTAGAGAGFPGQPANFFSAPGDAGRSIWDLIYFLANQGAFAGGEARKTGAKAGGGLDSALRYYQRLLGGNPADMAEALGPEFSSTASQFDLAQQGASQNLPRGGGRNQVMANLPFQKAATISSMIPTARAGAAGGAADVGGRYLAAGPAYLNAASQATGLPLQKLVQLWITRDEKQGGLGGVLGQILGELLGGYESEPDVRGDSRPDRR
jgi:hypothetical protein